jgi:tripartite-type tricarboxylate transporter receptor subunit TctC
MRLTKYTNLAVAITICGAAFSAVHSTANAQAATFSDQPIRIVVPFSPGGGTDVISRTLAVTMADELKRSVIVDNKPGGGTTIGSDYVAKAPADGHTLLMATFAHAVNPSLRAKMPYDTDRAFAPVVLIGRSPNILVVRADSPYKNVQDILTAARANPGKITYASQGVGTSAHLAGELFGNLAGVNVLHIPYKGAGPALNDLVGGQVDMMFATATAAAPLIDGGKLRALGVTTTDRSPARPDVPTVAEAGVPGYAAESWYGLYAPAGTPRPIIELLNAAATKGAQSENFKKRVEDQGLAISTGTPEALQVYVDGEQKRWAGVVKAANLEPR